MTLFISKLATNFLIYPFDRRRTLNIAE